MSSNIPNDAPRPRLCHLRKWPDFNGYGFNLHAERGKTGHYVGSIDDSSPSQAAGLRVDDRIVEVNGVNIGNENHRQVVERIKSVSNETKLLVIDREGDAYYQDLKIVITGDLPNVDYHEAPASNPYSEALEVTSAKSSSSEVHFEAAAPAPVPVSHGHSVGQDHHVGLDHDTGEVHSVGQGHKVSQGNKKGLQLPSSAREAREKMSKKRGAKATGMTLQDKYDLLQQL